MATRALFSKHLPLVRERFCKAYRPTRAAARVLSGTADRPQLHQIEGSSVLTGKLDRFGGVTVNLADIGLPEDISESAFSRLLQGLWNRTK